MNIANVASRFAQLAGISNSQIYSWKSVIDDACSYVQSIVTKSDLETADKLRLETLCAIYAYRLYSLCNEEEIASFTAGDVQITSSSSADSGSRAERLWKEYSEQCRDLLQDNSFLFGAVM